jgi:hypothetical protein
MEEVFTTRVKYSFDRQNRKWYIDNRELDIYFIGSYRPDDRFFVPELEVGNFPVAVSRIEAVIEASEGCLRLEPNSELMVGSPIKTLLNKLKDIYRE